MRPLRGLQETRVATREDEDRNAAVIYHTLLQPATTGTLTLEARNVFARCAKDKGEVFVGGRRETLISLDFCRGPEGTSQGASER